MADAITYETTTCTRCGGCGHYSYNQMDGTVCFKCRGSGKQLTKRGAVTRDYVNSLLDVRIENLPEGRMFQYIDAFMGKGWKFCIAKEIESSGSHMVDGEMVPMRCFVVINRKGEKVGGVGEGVKVRMHPNAEEIEEVMAYQESLTKAGKPRKR